MTVELSDGAALLARIRELESRLEEHEEALDAIHRGEAEAMGQLISALAHDFNNVLTGISGSLEMIGLRLAQGRTSELDRYVTAAQGAVARAGALTRQLLALSLDLDLPRRE